jgi:hypothetical protein
MRLRSIAYSSFLLYIYPQENIQSEKEYSQDEKVFQGGNENDFQRNENEDINNEEEENEALISSTKSNILVLNDQIDLTFEVLQGLEDYFGKEN